MRRLLTTATGGGVLTTLLATGWAGVALAVTVVIVLTAAVCWIVADPHRPRRLALLIQTWRGTRSP